MSDVEANPQLEAQAHDSSAPKARQLVAERGEHRWRLGYAEPPADDRSFTIEIDGVRRVVKQLPFNTVRVTEGSLHHAVAADPGSAAERFAQNPAEVVVQLLRDMRAPMNKAEIENKLMDLHLPPPDGWWPKVAKELKSHKHVSMDGPRYAWSQVVVEKAAPQPRSHNPGSSPRRPRKGFGEVVVTHRQDVPPHPDRSEPLTDDEPPPAAPLSSAPLAERAGDDPEGRAAPGGRGQAQASREAGRAVRQALEGLLAGKTADTQLLAAAATDDENPLSRLAAALRRVATDDSSLGLEAVELTALPAPMRYDLGRLALRRRSWPAFVQCLFAAEAGDTARLLQQVTPDSGLLESLMTSAEALKRIDARHTERWEVVLRSVADGLQHDSSLAGPALGLLASLGRLSSLAEHRGLTHAAQDLLHDTLSCREAVAALADAERQAALALVTSAIARPGRDHRLTWVLLVLALDDAGRGDVLGSPAAWTPADLSILRDRPRLASVLERHGVGERILPSMLESALKQTSASEVMQILSLPVPVLRRVPPATLAALLQRLAQEEDSPVASVLAMLVDRLQHSAARSGADEVAEQAARFSAEVDRLRAALAVEKESHDHARRQLAAFRAEDRHEDTTAVTQARLQTLRVVVELVEETRLAAAASPDSASMRDLVSRLVPLLSAQGIRAAGTAGDVMPYEPARFRVLGDGVALEADDPAVVVRPAYVLSEGSETVLRHGEVRPSSRGDS